jgi:hypothetical protein
MILDLFKDFRKSRFFAPSLILLAGVAVAIALLFRHRNPKLAK